MSLEEPRRQKETQYKTHTAMTDQIPIGPKSASIVNTHKRGLRAHYALCSSLKTRNRFARRPSSTPWLFLGFASFQPLLSTKEPPPTTPRQDFTIRPPSNIDPMCLESRHSFLSTGNTIRSLCDQQHGRSAF